VCGRLARLRILPNKFVTRLQEGLPIEVIDIDRVLAMTRPALARESDAVEEAGEAGVGAERI
jgi:hypothetical protein